MRLRLILTALTTALLFSSLRAEDPDRYPYKVEIVRDKVLAVTRDDVCA